MDRKEAAIRRWLGQVYNNRGHITDEAWPKFAAFYKELGYWDDITPGRRVDGKDPWDILEQNLVDDTDAKL